MRLADLERLGGRFVNISPESWAAALLLGRARERTNHGRARDADRGADGNAAVDLHGALGELLLLRTVRELSALEAAAYMVQHMLDPDGGRGVKGPDLEFSENGQMRGIDVKTFDCEPNKRFFAVNARKHDDLSGRCDAYLALIAPRFGQRGVLAKLVPYQDVSTWGLGRLRSTGNPSRNLPFREFEARYLRQRLDLDQLRARRHAAEAIEELAADRRPGSVAATLSVDFPLVMPA